MNEELSLSLRLGLNPPNEYKVKKPLPETGVDPSLLYGVELEIEGLDADEGIRAQRIVPGMEYHKDGSLRNNGGEFVTYPMRFSTLEYILNQFFLKNALGPENYSERCSVHVHANCCDLTADQVRLVLCLYQILEKVLFNYIKADRDNNIFCVPLCESIIGSSAVKSSADIVNPALGRRWRKYTALNLIPLYSQGTVEFRHMAGTHDMDRILQWCNIIGSIFKFCRENTYTETINSLMELNTSSAYSNFMQTVFRDSLYDVLAVGAWREYLEDGVLNMKVMLSSEVKEAGNKKITIKQQIFDDVINAVRIPQQRFVDQNNNIIIDEIFRQAPVNPVRF